MAATRYRRHRKQEKIKMRKYYILLIAAVFMASCGQSTTKEKENVVEQKLEKVNEVAYKTIVEKVDALNAQLEKVNAGMTLVASLDHHRMAKEVGVYTPPAIAGIFSDPKINTAILAKK